VPTIPVEKMSKYDQLILQKKEILVELNKNFKMEKLRVLSEEDPNYLRKKKFYKLAKSQLPRCAKWYLWINKNYINQVFFIENVNDANRSKEETSKGILKT